MRRSILLTVLAVLAAPPLVAQQQVAFAQDLGRLSIEELAQIKVTSVSKTEEPLNEAAAAIFVITCLLTAIPTAIVVWFTKEFQIRAAGFFACAGAAIGALSISVLLRSPAVWTSGLVCLFVVAGFVAGLTYWFVMSELATGEDSM